MRWKTVAEKGKTVVLAEPFIASTQQRINLLRQFPVFVGDGVACIVGIEPDLDRIVHIRPPRVVIHLLCRQRHAGHKGKSR